MAKVAHNVKAAKEGEGKQPDALQMPLPQAVVTEMDLLQGISLLE